VARSGTEFDTAVSNPCPTNTAPLAGGFAQPDAITGFVGNDYSDYVPYQSKLAGDRWQVAGEHGGNPPSKLVATAYCG
jgi:hypothetical protein